MIMSAVSIVFRSSDSKVILPDDRAKISEKQRKSKWGQKQVTSLLSVLILVPGAQFSRVSFWDSCNEKVS